MVEIVEDGWVEERRNIGMRGGGGRVEDGGLVKWGEGQKVGQDTGGGGGCG